MLSLSKHEGVAGGRSEKICIQSRPGSRALHFRNRLIFEFAFAAARTSPAQLNRLMRFNWDAQKFRRGRRLNVAAV
jgi:hypothetical protein